MRSATFQVLLFGPAREAVGSDRAEVEVPVPATAAHVLAALGRIHPALVDLMPRSRVAVNRRYVDLASPVSSGDGLAIIPPVGGG